MVELHGAVVQEVPYGLPQSSYYGPAFNTYNKAAAHYGTAPAPPSRATHGTVVTACCLLLQAIGTGIEALILTLTNTATLVRISLSLCGVHCGLVGEGYLPQY
jgi:hypothetical protein